MSPTVARVNARPLTELTELLQLIEEGQPYLKAHQLCEIVTAGKRFPVHALTLGSDAPDAPAVGFFGGVHGLERIGAEVVMSYLRNLVKRLRWDSVLHQQLQGLRLVFMPLVNPAGLWRGTRANANGVDLMRNSPVDAIEAVPFLAGGQRLSPRLPWYRGRENAPMEAESQALCTVVEEELLHRPFSLAIDCHSGFGVNDRIWFPYAYTSRPIPHLAEMQALATIFDQACAHHRYIVEPQSCQYLTHGDLWDHLYLRSCQLRDGLFLPLTLEMGSWIWVKKNPRQLFSRFGIFNPLIKHRQDRVMRRHMALLDFFMRAASSHANWLPQDGERERQQSKALQRWFNARQA